MLLPIIAGLNCTILLLRRSHDVARRGYLWDLTTSSKMKWAGRGKMLPTQCLGCSVTVSAYRSDSPELKDVRV